LWSLLYTVIKSSSLFISGLAAVIFAQSFFHSSSAAFLIFQAIFVICFSVSLLIFARCSQLSFAFPTTKVSAISSTKTSVI